MFFDENPSISSPHPPSESWPELEDIDINNENPRSLDEDNIDLLKTYGLGPYSNNIKKVEKEVKEKSKKLKSSLLLQIDGTSPIAKDIERRLLTYGRRIPFAERFAWIDALDASTIKRIAN